MRKPRKAQTAIEYLLMIGAVIVFVIGINYLISQYVFAPGGNEANLLGAGVQQLLAGIIILPSATPTPLPLTCGTTINAPGTYSLSSDLVCPQYGLLINASSVVLDCQHQTITGPMTDCSSPYSGIAVIGSQTGVTIQNCIVTNFCYCITAGTAWRFGELSNGIIRDNYANACYYGLTGSMSSTSFTDNNASNNVFAGVYFAVPNNDFSNTRACDNAVFDFDFVASQASNTNSYCGNNYCYQTDAWNLCTPNSPTYGNCQHCCGRCPPTVTLDAPNGASLAKHAVVAFNYTPSDDEAFANATLYTNEGGTWAERAYNASPLTNDTLNTIYYQVDNTGTFEWNVLVCDDDACGWAASNYSFTVTCETGDICYCPYVITSPGTYRLASDLNCPDTGDAINITAPDVYLNCSGHELNGPGSGSSRTGVNADNVYNVTVFNCTIRNFQTGIRYYASPNGSIIQNLLQDNYYGIIDSVFPVPTQTLIENNTIDNSTQDGIQLFGALGVNQSDVVRNNTVTNSSTGGIYITQSGNNTIEYNHLTQNHYGTNLGINSAYNQLKNNFYSACDFSAYIQSQYYNLVYNNTIVNTLSTGAIYINRASNANISYNRLTNNTYFGIYASTGSDFENNSISYNQIFNASIGIFIGASAANFRFNDFSYNNITNTTSYGIQLGGGSNNTVSFNRLTNGLNWPAISIFTYATKNSEYNNVANNTISNYTNSYGVFLQGYDETHVVQYTNVSYNTAQNNSYGVVANPYTSSNNFTGNNLCANTNYAFYLQNTQSGSSNDMCEASKCWQDGAYNVCVPNAGGAGNCQQSCPVAGTPISSCPYTISLAGSYAVTTDLSCAGNGITVSAANVNLDCQNHVLTGPGSGTGIGISAAYNYVNVTNCVVKNFQNGISMNNNDYCRLISNTAYSNTNNGIYVQSTSDSNTFQNNNASYNTQNGIYLYGDANSNQFVTNIARKNGYSGINFSSASGYPGSNNVSGNTVENNTQYGFYCSTMCDPNRFSNNRFCFNGASYYDVYAGYTQLSSTNDECSLNRCYQGGAYNICNPNTAGARNCTNATSRCTAPAPTDNPPAVSLNEPNGVALPKGATASFNYTPTDDRGFASATLYTNESGWAARATNASAIVNATKNTIQYLVNNIGTFAWNAYVCDNSSQCVFAAANYTYRVSAPTVSLNAPNGGSFANGETVLFNYTPSTEYGFASATLYTDEGDVWAARATNASAVVNAALNTISYAVNNGGYYSWNVRVCDTYGSCSWAASNYTYFAACATPFEICYCPYTISSSGSYYFNHNITCNSSAHGITVNANDVDIDGSNYRLYGPGTSYTSVYGVYASERNNVATRRATITNYYMGVRYSATTNGNVVGNTIKEPLSTGVYINGTTDVYDLIENNTITNASGNGVFLYSLAGANTSCTVRNNTITEKNTFGVGGVTVSRAGNNLVENNTLQNNGNGVFMYSSSPRASYNRIRYNTIRSNTYGVYSYGDYRNSYLNNQIVQNTYGFFSSDSGAVQYIDISYNNISYNAQYGLYLNRLEYSTISYNDINNNGGSGAYAGLALVATIVHGGVNMWLNTISHNNINYNSYDGLYGAGGGTPLVANIFDSNTLRYNARYGMYLSYVPGGGDYSNNFSNNNICGNLGTYDLYASNCGTQNSIGELCGLNRCNQTGAYGMCDPNVTGVGNCTGGSSC